LSWLASFINRFDQSHHRDTYISKDSFWQHLYLFGDYPIFRDDLTHICATRVSEVQIGLLPVSMSDTEIFVCRIQPRDSAESFPWSFTRVTSTWRTLSRIWRVWVETWREERDGERERERERKKERPHHEVSLTPVRRWSTSIVSPPLYIRPLPPSYSVAASRWHSCPPFLLAVCKRVLRWRNAGYSTWLASDEMPMATIRLCESFLRFVYPL